MNTMRNLAKRRPIAVSIGIMLMATILMQLVGIVISLIIPYDGSYFLNMVIELFVVGIALMFAAIFSKLDMLYTKRLGFFKSMVPCMYLLIAFLLNLLLSLTDISGAQLRHPVYIVIFCITMILIGCAEEFLYRGVITGIILDKYGKDGAGIWFTAIISGIIFGLAHLSNALSGISFSAVLIQVVMVTFVGMVFSAIYIRTKNIWIMVFLHALNDFVALFETGFFNQGNIASEVNSYSVVMYGGMITYGIILAVLLRKSKLYEMLGKSGIESSEKSERRLYKTICFASCAVIACMAYGVIELFI